MTKLSLTRSERKKLGKINNVDNLDYKPLSSKQVKYYKKLIEEKLDKMGVSGDTLMTTTNKTKWVYYIDHITRNPMRKQVPVHRLSNFKKNLVKKLMKLSIEDVHRFLDTEFNQPETKDSVQIQGLENVTGT